MVVTAKELAGDSEGVLSRVVERRERALIQRAQTGRKLGLAPTVNISITIQRYRQRLSQDRRERALAARVEKMINETI